MTDELDKPFMAFGIAAIVALFTLLAWLGWLTSYERTRRYTVCVQAGHAPEECREAD